MVTRLTAIVSVVAIVVVVVAPVVIVITVVVVVVIIMLTIVVAVAVVLLLLLLVLVLLVAWIIRWSIAAGGEMVVAWLWRCNVGRAAAVVATVLAPTSVVGWHIICTGRNCRVFHFHVSHEGRDSFGCCCHDDNVDVDWMVVSVLPVHNTATYKVKPQPSLTTLVANAT